MRERKARAPKPGRAVMSDGSNRRINVRVDAVLLDNVMARIRADAAAGRASIRGRWNLTSLIHEALTEYVLKRGYHDDY